jgi:hypothetical protein
MSNSQKLALLGGPKTIEASVIEAANKSLETGKLIEIGMEL